MDIRCTEVYIWREGRCRGKGEGESCIDDCKGGRERGSYVEMALRGRERGSYGENGAMGKRAGETERDRNMDTQRQK